MAVYPYPAFMGVPPVYLASALASQKLFSSLSFAESFSSVREVRAKKFRMMLGSGRRGPGIGDSNVHFRS